MKPIPSRWLACLAAALFAISGCTGIHEGHLFPVPDENTTFLPKSKGAAVSKNGVAVVVASMPDVKEADGFFVIIYNSSGQWVSFDRAAVRLLDHNGQSFKPLTRQEQNFLLGARFQPKPPIGIKGDIFRWDRTLSVQGDWVSPLNPEEVIRTSVMHGGKAPFYVYFRRQSGRSPRLTLIIPNVELGSSMEKLTYVFRFAVQTE
ncbi:hypothetical protein FJZ36_10220 [Candidatus Poribacteria bacterium]|nr:hypothetical protein [Candidatus Poribacteria bacterium]